MRAGLRDRIKAWVSSPVGADEKSDAIVGCRRLGGAADLGAGGPAPLHSRRDPG